MFFVEILWFEILQKNHDEFSTQKKLNINHERRNAIVQKQQYLKINHNNIAKKNVYRQMNV